MITITARSSTSVNPPGPPPTGERSTSRRADAAGSMAVARSTGNRGS